MGVAFFFQAAEVRYPRSSIVSMGKAASTVFVGAWLVEIGVVMYTGRAAWTNEASRAAAAMLAPIFFCMIFLAICVGMLALYVVLVALQKRGLVPSSLVGTCVEGGKGDDDADAPRHRAMVGGRKHWFDRDCETGNLMTERSFDSDSAHN